MDANEPMTEEELARLVRGDYQGWIEIRPGDVIPGGTLTYLVAPGFPAPSGVPISREETRIYKAYSGLLPFQWPSESVRMFRRDPAH